MAAAIADNVNGSNTSMRSIATKRHQLTLIVVGSLSSISGGYVYEAQMMRHITQRFGHAIDINIVEIKEPLHPLFVAAPPPAASPSINPAISTSWPHWWPSCTTHTTKDDPALVARTAAIFASIPIGSTVIIDGMAVIDLAVGLTHIAALNRYRLVYLIHYPFTCDTDVMDDMRRLVEQQERVTFAVAESFIAASDVSKRLLIDTFHVNEEKITVVAPGIDRATFIYPSPLPSSATTPVVVSDIVGPVRFVCVANGIPRKNLLWLLQCFSRATAQHHRKKNSPSSTPSTLTADDHKSAAAAITNKEWTLDIIGNFTLDHTYMARVRSLLTNDMHLRDTVHLITDVIQPVDMATRVYQRAHVFVTASLFENYGMALAEAVHMGLPVITTRVGEAAAICPRDSW